MTLSARTKVSAALPVFPWDTLADATATARAHPDGIVDLSVGTPVDDVAPVIREALAAAGLKDGGPVRGPGTGTSDDVPDTVREGTYIMPADSTQAIGEKTLGGLGMRGVDVNLSNGEFKLPPKQVHAIGVQALNQMKDATHTPSSTEAAKGMKPELFFEGGGVASEEERQKRLQNQTQAYVTGAQAAAAAAPATPAAPVPAAPAPAAKDPLDGGAAFGVFPQLAGGKRTTYAMDEKLRTGVEATGPSTFVQATPLDKTIIGGGNGQRLQTGFAQVAEKLAAGFRRRTMLARPSAVRRSLNRCGRIFGCAFAFGVENFYCQALAWQGF